jgi:tetratricopeptide (TPR) repeat protein
VSNGAATVGLALIVRDEQDALPNLLASIEGAFDQVVLVDTGSTDRTVDVFRDWARTQAGLPWQVGHFTWIDDFAAARAHADSLLTTDWTCWADADDILHGAANLRALAAQAPPDLVAYVADYDYAQDQHQNCICVLRRERLVRRGAGQWVGRVHEAQLFQGGSARLDPGLVLWQHRKNHAAIPSQPRNLRILRKWLRDEPSNPRVLQYMGTETAAIGNHKRAVGYYKRYLRLKTGWDEERAQVHRKLALSLYAIGRLPEARAVALEALTVLPEWPDSYLSLAQVAYAMGEYAKAVQWANRVLELGQPDSLLILNPLDYTFQPRLVQAAALGAMGMIDDAIQVAEAALSMVPDHGELRAHVAGWRQQSKRDVTAQTYVGFARQHLAHDEQLKALRLLEECVPHYCTDHPEIVALRSQLRERVRPLLTGEGMADHYLEATELGIPDLDIVPHLPRAQMLRAGLLEQLAEAA